VQRVGVAEQIKLQKEVRLQAMVGYFKGDRRPFDEFVCN